MNNVKPGSEHNFEKRSFKNIEENLPYDMASVMHYKGREFSTNGDPTIEALDSTKKMGGRNLTLGDVNLLNKMYNC